MFLLARDLGEHVRLAQDEEILALDLDLGAAVLRVQDLVALGDVERDALVAILVPLALTDCEDLALWGFSFAVSGRTMPLAVVSSSSIA